MNGSLARVAPICVARHAVTFRVRLRRGFSNALFFLRPESGSLPDARAMDRLPITLAFLGCEKDREVPARDFSLLVTLDESRAGASRSPPTATPNTLGTLQ